MAINTCIEKLSGVILEALAVSTLTSLPGGDPWPLILARIQDEIRL